MRINVYSQELITDPGEARPDSPDYELDTKTSNTGLSYSAVRMFLHSSNRLHHPPETVGTVEQLVVGFVGDGLTPGDAGELIATSVMAQCPQFAPVLRKFVAAYTGAGTVRA